MNLQDAKIERISGSIKSKYSEIPIRLYKFEEQIGISVSTACSVIVPLQLQNWFKKSDPEKIDDKLKATADIGSNGHSLIEKQAAGEEVKPDENLETWFNSWNQTQKQFSISAEMSEVKVFSKMFAFGGQIDRVGEFEGKRCIIDFKTGHYSHINLWKTEAYRQAYIEMTGDRDIGAVVLHLPRPDLLAKGEKVRHYTIERHDTCFLNFLCAYQTFSMLYYTDLLKAGLTEKDVYANKPFIFYEQLKER